ncbi:hypothetical protein [Thalassotalea crassostreae]|uniref:hypothetical protein n=1 Tax=Thalassotalea crassostreae TaxID=1763536 RepID=UPI0008A5D991|nr:hypothetical protein [Thalassotalea crassostreae]
MKKHLFLSTLIYGFSIVVSIATINTAFAQVSMSSSNFIFRADIKDSAMQSQQLVLTFDAPTTLSLDDFQTTALIGDSISFNVSDCINTWQANDMCAILVNYQSAGPGNHSSVLSINDVVEGETIKVFASNFNFEPATDEAQRRLSPIIAYVEIIDVSDTQNPSLVTDGPLLEQTPYTMNVIAMAYDDIALSSYIFNCVKDSDEDNIYDEADSNCGTSVYSHRNPQYVDDSDNGVIDGAFVNTDQSDFISGEVLTNNQAQGYGLSGYSFRGEKASYTRFSYNFILPQGTKTVVNDALVIRFLAIQDHNIKHNMDTGVSTILSGNLNFLNLEESAYYQQDGRRLTVTVLEND